jgi:AcrR family transcriptional regulator
LLLRLDKKNDRSYVIGMTRGEDTRRAVLEHAFSVASRVGLDGLTIGRLAEDLSLSKSGLFGRFQSKQALQVQVLQHAADRFVDAVVRPALKAPRGEARVRQLFERWIDWPRVVPQPGGCIFVAAATELDDKPGPARDLLVKLQRDWLEVIAGAVRTAVSEGDFHRQADPEQFAQDLYGVMLACHHASRLLGDPKAVDRARAAFEALVGTARGTRRPRTH